MIVRVCGGGKRVLKASVGNSNQGCGLRLGEEHTLIYALKLGVCRPPHGQRVLAVDGLRRKERMPSDRNILSSGSGVHVAGMPSVVTKNASVYESRAAANVCRSLADGVPSSRHHSYSVVYILFHTAFTSVVSSRGILYTCAVYTMIRLG